MWGLTQSIALDGRPHNIIFSCLHPGNVRIERRQDTSIPANTEPMMEMETIAQAALATYLFHRQIARTAAGAVGGGS